jgi:hypothetical protein
MFDENSKYPDIEFEMAAVSGNFRCFVFNPDKHILLDKPVKES